MNDEQWKFIYKHYPDYGLAPYEMMTWLFGQAKIQEDMVAEQYGKPSVGGVTAGGDDDDISGLDNKYDKAFGPKSQKNKQTQKQQAD